MVCSARRLDFPIHLLAEEMFVPARQVRRSTTKVASAAQVAVRLDAVPRRRRSRNSPERCPAPVHDFRPSASVAVVAGEPVDSRPFPAQQRLAARLVDPAFVQVVEVAKVVVRPASVSRVAKLLLLASVPPVAKLLASVRLVAELRRVE